MAEKVGIPRGLFYYRYFPLWKTVFEEIGARRVVSCPTNKKILNDGTRTCVDEACLPVKVYHGHVMDLCGKADFLFVPRLTSVSKGEYICPKFGGLPDMVRHTVRGLPEIIDTEINLRKSERHVFRAVMETGRRFTCDGRRIRDAYRKAMDIHKKYRAQLKTGSMPFDVLENGDNPGRQALEHSPGRQSSRGSLNMAVRGHVYTLNDPYINLNMVQKIRKAGVNIVTAEMVDDSVINENAGLLHKKIFWDFGRRAMGGLMHLLERDDIDGIIYVMSFGCGIDSFICDLAERRNKRGKDKPFIAITLDEHSGEAGLNTRIEAFVDMIGWRRKRDNPGRLQ
jgi:predicted nucleotide-binding protein (sugar kinase/HSP70/actin superfamily)